jgi:hypothetical protein
MSGAAAAERSQRSALARFSLIAGVVLNLKGEIVLKAALLFLSTAIAIALSVLTPADAQGAKPKIKL